VGALYNVTGGMSSIDAPGLNGAKLAVREWNARGGVLGRRIVLAAEDGKTDQTVVATAMSRLINVQKVVVVGGLNDSTFALAAGPIAQKARIPFVIAGATLPNLPDQIGDYAFMAPFTDDAQAFVGAIYTVRTLKAKRVWIMTDKAYDYTLTLTKFYKQKLLELGGAVVAEDVYQSGDKDYSAQITRLRRISPAPDALFISAVPDDIGLVVRQIRSAGIKIPIVGGDGYDTELLVKIPGKALADNIHFTTHVSLTSKAPVVASFVKAYTQAYRHGPENAFAALGYDTFNLILDAVKRAGKADSQAIKAALEATRGFRGVTGTISFEGGRHVPKKSVTVIRVVKGVFQFAGETTP
ncbi:MAG: ABC transporter substrate-binding protein, partial [Armatimonadota bacterium]|nr:ABC transporter substrate-binding protein [Armatimonadota bacterium]